MKLSIFRYIFKIPDLRKRILFTLFMFAVYRLGAAVPAVIVKTISPTLDGV